MAWRGVYIIGIDSSVDDIGDDDGGGVKRRPFVVAASSLMTAQAMTACKA